MEYLIRYEIENGVYGFCTYFLLRDVKEYYDEKHCILKEKIETPKLLKEIITNRKCEE